MSFEFNCPQGHRLVAEHDEVGTTCKCPSCGEMFVIPSPVDVVPQPPSGVPSTADQYVYRDRQVAIGYNALHLSNPDMTIAMGLIASVHRKTETQERDVFQNIAAVGLRQLLRLVSYFVVIGGFCTCGLGIAALVDGRQLFGEGDHHLPLGLSLLFVGLALIVVFAKAIKATKRKTCKYYTYHLMVVASGVASSVLASDDASYIDRLVNLFKQVKDADRGNLNPTPVGSFKWSNGLPEDKYAAPATPIPAVSDPHRWQEINGRKTAAGVLALIFACFAVHKFYLGKYTAGLVSLIFCIVTLGYGCFIMSPIAWYEGVKYLRMSPEEFEQTYIVQRKDWF